MEDVILGIFNKTEDEGLVKLIKFEIVCLISLVNY
jgi:hypothetical protein